MSNLENKVDGPILVSEGRFLWITSRSLVSFKVMNGSDLWSGRDIRVSLGVNSLTFCFISSQNHPIRMVGCRFNSSTSILGIIVADIFLMSSYLVEIFILPFPFLNSVLTQWSVSHVIYLMSAVFTFPHCRMFGRLPP